MAGISEVLHGDAQKFKMIIQNQEDQLDALEQCLKRDNVVIRGLI